MRKLDLLLGLVYLEAYFPRNNLISGLDFAI